MPNKPNTMSPELRKRLDADADRAEANGDEGCAETLRQLAAYKGTDAAQWARDLGTEPCAKKYASAHDLMELVVRIETGQEPREQKPGRAAKR